MVHHKSAEKMIRKTEKRTLRNRSIMSSVRTIIKSVKSLSEKGEHVKAREMLVVAQSKIMKAAQKGIIKKSNGSRKVSRLSQFLKVRALAARESQ